MKVHKIKRNSHKHKEIKNINKMRFENNKNVYVTNTTLSGNHLWILKHF